MFFGREETMNVSALLSELHDDKQDGNHNADYSHAKSALQHIILSPICLFICQNFCL